MVIVGNVQLGKNGLTKNFFLTLENQFRTHENVKIHVLKSARGEGKQGKEKVKEFSKKILEELGRRYTAKIVGFTIIIKKWRKAKR